MVLQYKELVSKIKGDRVIWGVVLLLSLISLMAVYSSTGSLAYRMHYDSNHYFVKQVVVLALGLFITFIVHNINYKVFSKVAVWAYWISIPLLIFTLVKGTTYNDGARWLTVPFVHLTFQTSDLAKLSLFMYLANMMSLRQATIKDFKDGFFPVLLPTIITCGCIAPANLSTALMLGVTCSILFFIGRVRMMHLMLLFGMGIIGIALLFAASKITHRGRASTWEKRIVSFLKPAKNDSTLALKSGKKGMQQEDEYQVQQAKIAIVNGGLTGLGPGKSIQRNLLPHPYSDFIFAIIIEEYGLLGGFFLMCLYLTFLWRCVSIFRRCPYAFGAFLAVGLSMTLVFQAMINMAVNVHLVPVTGQTLPMVSMGGSSIWFTSIAIGVILSVSRYVDETEGLPKKGPKIPKPSPVAPTVDPKSNSTVYIQTGSKSTIPNTTY